MWASSALRSSALDGMQPTLRHTPPQYFSSTTATDLPSWAARMAATYPPGPAPRTRTSKWVTAPSLLRCATGPTQALACSAVTLYAAYGTNLDPARMGERCPHSPLRTTGWLQGWRLTFGGEEHGWDGALSTIVQDPFEQVFVAVYDVTREDESAPRRLGGGRLRALPQDQGAGRRP